MYAKEEWPEGHRPCKKCHKMQPLTNFHKHKACLFGVNTVCKQCRKMISVSSWRSKASERKILDRTKSRAQKRDIPFDLEVEDISIPEVCPVLQIPLIKGDPDATPSIDRIIPDLGYVKGNVRIISNRANMLKNNATLEELQLILEDALRVKS